MAFLKGGPDSRKVLFRSGGKTGDMDAIRPIINPFRWRTRGGGDNRLMYKAARSRNRKHRLGPSQNSRFWIVSLIIAVCRPSLLVMRFYVGHLRVWLHATNAPSSLQWESNASCCRSHFPVLVDGGYRYSDTTKVCDMYECGSPKALTDGTTESGPKEKEKPLEEVSELINGPNAKNGPI